MKRNVLFLFLAIFISFSQSANEELSIKKTIQNYFDGYNSGNIDLLKKAFHPECVIKYNDLRSKEYKTLTMWQLNDFMKRLPEGWSSESKIHSIDVFESIAQAKVTVHIPMYKLTWTDFIGLLKVNGSWMIVTKISHGEIKK